MPQPAFPTAHQSLLLDGPAGALEVVVDFPEPAEARPLVAVVCHPLPTEGGTMHNKVVTMVARALRELGATTVRFNFRGTGGSAKLFACRRCCAISTAGRCPLARKRRRSRCSCG